MKNVTTPVLIKQSKTDSHFGPAPEGGNFAKYQRALILQ
jgi:hypothetical protein